jgi:hypothetical protein
VRSGGSDSIRTEALDSCFDAFSSREAASTSLENAIEIKLMAAIRTFPDLRRTDRLRVDLMQAKES